MSSRGMRELFYGDPAYQTIHHGQPFRPYYRSQSAYPDRARGYLPVLELHVPMCCQKCEEKVKEELEELEGVQGVICDQFNQRVTITGFVDASRALKKVRKVKKKSEFFKDGSYIESSSSLSPYYPMSGDVQYTGNRMMSNHGYGLTRSNSFDRGLGRLPSFSRATPIYDVYGGDRFSDFYEPRDNYRGVRRMPSFNRHRHHDAEYISMDDQYAPFYGDWYSPSERPMYRSPMAFSNVLLTNPYYMHHIDSEYY